MRFRSFRGRVLAFFLVLFLAVQTAAFLAVHTAIMRNARAQAARALEVDAGVFARLLQDRSRRLIEAARLLSGDYAFKTVYGVGERGTLRSALRNQQQRISADVMILADLDGAVLADTRAGGTEGRPVEFPGLLASAADAAELEGSATVFLDSRPYQMVVVPLLTPVPDAWICVGFLLDDAFAADLRRLTRSQVSLASATAGGGWTILASSLPADQRGRLAQALPPSLRTGGSSRTIALGGEEHVTLAAPLGGAGLIAVLQRPLAEGLAPFLPLRSVLAALFLLGAVLTAGAAALLSRSVTRPVLRIAEAARRVEEGDYTARVEVAHQDEIGKLAASFNHMAQGLEERRRVTELLGKVVSPAIAQELLRRGIELGGEEREVTVLFSDIRGFTALSEKRSPHEVLDILNTYLTRMSAVIEVHGGVVDKYVGDAIMALFGAPLAQADDAARAVRAALAMNAELAALNADFAAAGQPELRIGVGINTGVVVAGNMGSRTRLNYTVIGDGVNLASRLEGLHKVYDIPVLVSAATRGAAPAFLYREIDRVRVVGRTLPVTVFEPLGPDGEVPPAVREETEAFHRMLEAYRGRDWEGAAALVARLAETAPGSALYRLYGERISQYRDHPPPREWDGAVDLTRK